MAKWSDAAILVFIVVGVVVLAVRSSPSYAFRPKKGF